MQLIQSLLFILVAVWLLMALLLYVYQSRFIYYPLRELVATPTDVGLKYEEVTLVSSDEVRLHGWWVPHERARATVIFLHGNGGNISYRLEKLALFHELGLATLIVDYRGYGNSDGKPSEQGTYQDAKLAWDYLTLNKSVQADEILVYGESLGAAVAIWLASHYRPGAVVIESGFASIVHMAKELYPWLPVSLLARIRYPSIERIGRINAPVLIFHSPHDEVIPYTQGQALYRSAKDPRTFVDLSGGHNDGYVVSRKAYTRGLNNLITSAFGIDEQ